MLIYYTIKDTPDASPPNRAPMVLAVNFALLGIAVLFVGLRLVVKSKLGRLAIEDALIVVSTVWILLLNNFGRECTFWLTPCHSSLPFR